MAFGLVEANSIEMKNFPELLYHETTFRFVCLILLVIA